MLRVPRKLKDLRLLDAGGESGILTATAVAEICARQPSAQPDALHATVWEIDDRLLTAKIIVVDQKWTKHSAARDAVYANRRRIRGARGRRLQRRRSEYLERPNAHLYETGGMRRTHLRGHANILKRRLVHVGGFNLGLLMRTVFGVGTPRSLQAQLAVPIGVVVALWGTRHDLSSPRDTRFADHEAMFTPYRHLERLPVEASVCGL